MFQPQAVIIAGPNGSGKSTAAMGLLPPGMPFVNADMIAQEISGVPGTAGDIGAGRILLSRLSSLVRNRQDFAFETTLAMVMLPTHVRRWQAAGYQVHLLYFWLPSDDLAVARVENRVVLGGHDVPEETIRRRYRAGLRNLHRYRELVDTWRVLDNSDPEGPVLVARGLKDAPPSVFIETIWRTMLEIDHG